jgi:hypothetical protein
MSAEPPHPLSDQARRQYEDEARALIQQAAQLTGAPKRDATVWFINRLRQGSYWRPLGKNVGWITDGSIAKFDCQASCGQKAAILDDSRLSSDAE